VKPSHRTALLFVEVTPEKTATLAKSFRIEENQEGRTLCFKLPEGGKGKVRLF
jgi:hypothetical protein